MKKLFLLVFALCASELTFAQNTFPGSGNVGIGTLSPLTSLDINLSGASLLLRGSASTWPGSDITIQRVNSQDQLARSPNLAFSDAATGTAAYIQAYQGNLQFWVMYQSCWY